MDCEVVHSKLVEFVEHELPESEAAHVEEHLRGCAACRLEAQQLAHASEALKFALPLLAPDVSYLTRSRRARLKRLRSRSRGARRFVTMPRLVASAAIAVILVSVWFLYHDLVSLLTPLPGPVSPERQVAEEQARVPLVLVSMEKKQPMGLPGERSLRRMYFAFSGLESRRGGLDYSKLIPVQPDDITIPVQNANYDSAEPAYWW